MKSVCNVARLNRLWAGFPIFHHLRASTGASRLFQSRSDYAKWKESIQASTFRPSAPLLDLQVAHSAPFLSSISPMADKLVLKGLQEKITPTAQGLSPSDSFLQVTLPLSTETVLRNSVTDLSNWSTFRLGKFYELVDAFSADVAYRHCTGQAMALVTAGHYYSRKLRRTDIHQDVVLRSYVTSVGRSSMEVRTDALQESKNGSLDLINVCHTVMVGLEKSTLSSLSKAGKRLPPLVLQTDVDRQRAALADQHQQIRRKRSENTMQLRLPMSSPPNVDEMKELHKLHQDRAMIRRQVQTGNARIEMPPTVNDFTFRSSTIIYPEARNVHGKLFGGFVMEEADKLAQYTATFFAKGEPVIPLGIDDAIFLQPVGIGDMVTFTARLIHSTATTCRVLVDLEVRDPSDRSRMLMRSNRLVFIFGGSNFDEGIIPESYREILMHTDAKRRHAVEGPSDEEVENILQEVQELKESRSSWTRYYIPNSIKYT